MRRHLGFVPLALLVSLASVATAPAASAETVRGTDPEADVRYFANTFDEGDEGRVVDRPTVDLVSTRLTYTTTRIQAVLRYQDLVPTGPARFFAGLQVEYPRAGGQRGYADVDVETTPTTRSGRSSVYVDSNPDARCPVRHKIDYTRNEVVLSLPSACLGNPRYVDVLVGTFLASRDYSKAYLDTAPGTDPDSQESIRVRRG